MPKLAKNVDDKRIHQIHAAYNISEQEYIRSLAKKHNLSLAEFLLTACKFYDKNFKNEVDSMFDIKKE